MTRIIISALYNDSAAFFDHYLDNFLAFTDENVTLIVNLSPKAMAEVQKSGQLHTRVFAIAGEVPRAMFGFSLLLAHLENFRFAQATLPEFAYFCPVASNSLFFRPLRQDLVLAALGQALEPYTFDINSLPQDWAWWSVVQRSGVLPQLQEKFGIQRVANAQIEGLFASRDDWGVLENKFEILREIGDGVPVEDRFPGEEVLPATLMAALGSGRFTHICHVHWTRYSQNYLYKVLVPDLLPSLCGLPAHICLQKAFQRTTEDILTWAVVNEQGRAMVAAADTVLRAGMTDARGRLLAERLFALGAEGAGRQALLAPLPAQNRHWRGRLELDTRGKNNGDMLRLLPDADTGDDATMPEPILRVLRPGYLSELTFDLTSGDDMKIRCVTSITTEFDEKVDALVLAHLFLPLNGRSNWRGNETIKLHMALPTVDAKAFAHNIAIMLDKTMSDWRIAYFAEGTDRQDYLLMSDCMFLAPKAEGPIWIGLPLFAQGVIDITIEVLAAAGPDGVPKAPSGRQNGLFRAC